MRILTGTIRWAGFFFYFLSSLAALSVVMIITIFFLVLKDLPQVPEPLSRMVETPATEIYSAEGEKLFVLGGREFVPLSHVSPYFIQAITAVEDHRFWNHHGIDKVRTLKALWITLFEPGKVQGASTITQQLAKNLFFSFKRSYKRKFHEFLVALQIESQYEKQEILEAYINQIPFAVGAYGIERAARLFFNKPASRLTLAESAMLAGLPKSPVRYNPYRHYQRAKKRQALVLARMEAVGAVSRQEASQALEEPLHLQARRSGKGSGRYFRDMVVKQLEEQYGADVVYKGGLKVTSTLDPRLQSQAEAAMKKGLEYIDSLMGIQTNTDDPGKMIRPQGALVAVETNSGAIKALVGGRDYDETEFNRALSNNRLPGSGFKPFLYYGAFETLGLSPVDTMTDQAVSIKIPGSRPWSPKNFNNAYKGKMILKKALIDSINTISAQLISRVGPENVIDVAYRCGIKSKLMPNLSLSLGTSGVSPLEMASAFAVFATGGIRYEPFCIKRVEDMLGRVMNEHIVAGEKNLDPGMVYQVVDMMTDVVDRGTGIIIRKRGFEPAAAGKTGTTDDYKDAWFTGFTPNLSTSVWIGYDQGEGLRDEQGRGITGGRAAAPVWADFMIQATAGEPFRDFTIPSSIHFEYADPETGCKGKQPSKHTVKAALLEHQTLCNDP